MFRKDKNRRLAQRQKETESDNDLLTNDSIQQFLKNSTGTEFEKNNRNVNGIVKMTNHFGDMDEKAEAKEFKNALKDIESIRSGVIPTKDAHRLRRTKLKDRINSIVQEFNKTTHEANEDGKEESEKSAAKEGTRRKLGTRQFRNDKQLRSQDCQEESTSQYEEDKFKEKRKRDKSERSLSKRQKKDTKVDKDDDESKLIYLNRKCATLYNNPVVREGEKLKKRMKYLQNQALFIEYITSNNTPIQEIKNLLLRPIPK